MDLKGKKIVVTGAGGFIGSHLVERLVTEGANVAAFVRYNSRGDIGCLRLLSCETQDAIAVVMGDLRDVEAVRKLIAGADIVFHLGALIAIPYSYVHPREVVDTNIMGTLNVLTAALEAGAQRVVHTSTSEVYGTAQYVPIDESHPLQGQSPYSASKIGADKVAESFHKSFGLPVSTLRPFNTFGPRQSMRAVIPTIIAQAIAGDEVRLGSLSPSRDFTFVTDTVDGFVRMATTEEAIGREVNIGGGYSITVGDLAGKIFDLLGQNPRILSDDTRVRPENSEVLRLHASNALASDLIGWTPQVPLDEGLRRTIEWISGNMGLFRTNQYVI